MRPPGPSLTDDRMLDGNRHLDEVLSDSGERLARQIVAVRLDAARPAISQPVEAGEISPAAPKRCNQRTALAILTPKRLAAALRDIPSLTTVSTTHLRRSSASAIP